YQNKEDIFKAESLNSSKLIKNPLRYWRTVLLHASKLAEFAYRFFSIPPNSTTSERI
ncbi:18781_t:CDS:1, partial [Funneliformis geosporum]